MIRASLSDRRSNVQSCCRWLLTNGGGGSGGGDRRLKRRLPINTSPSQSIKSSHYHSLSRNTDIPVPFHRCHRRRSSLWNPTTENVSHRTTAVTSSSMSTKPSYDFSELDDDDDDDIDGHGDSGHQLRWMKRSSGLDSFSQYDNFHRDESHHGTSRDAVRFAEEESLLNLLNDSNGRNGGHAHRMKPLPENKTGEDESLFHLLSDNMPAKSTRAAHVTRPLDDKFEEDSSLLNLLSNNDNVERSETPPDDSLLNLLNDSKDMNGTRMSGVTKHSNDTFGEAESLLDLLNSDDVEDYSATENGAGSHHVAYPDDNGGDYGSLLQVLKRGNTEDYLKPSSQISYNEDTDDETHLQHQQNEVGGSLMDLLNGHADESQSSLSSELNGYDMNLQYQPHDTFEDETAEPLHDLLNEETKDIDKDKKYKELSRLQLQLEIESTEEAIRKRLNVWNAARDRSSGYDTIPAVRRTLDSWYGPLTDAIELEQWLYLNNDNKTCSYKTLSVEGAEADDNSQDDDQFTLQRSVKDRSVYGPLLCLLPPQKIAVLLAHTALSFSIADKEGQFKVVSLALFIAQALETEVNVSRALRVRAKERKLKMPPVSDEEGSDNGPILSDIAGSIEGENTQSEGVAIDNWVYTATHLQRFLDELKTGDKKSLKGKGVVQPSLVRKRCKEILLAEGFMPEGSSESEEADENKPLSMNDFAEWDPVKKVKLGASLIRLLLDHAAFEPQEGRRGATPEPAFRYLRTRNNRGKTYGCVSLHPGLFDVAVNEEFSSTSTFIPPTMGSDRVQPMVVPPRDWTDVNNGGYEVIKVPFMRTRHCKTQKDSIHRADMSKVMDGLNVLGKIPWKVNQKVLDAALKCWDNGIALGDIPSQENYEVPPAPDALPYQDYKTLGDFEKKIQLDAYKRYREALAKHNRFKQKNSDLHSLRCSAMLKLNQAKKFRDFDEIFFPYNVDFRGRAYPVTPHLSIVGSDLCRALLMFAEPKPLGENGLYWLKVHLANLAGADKMSFDGRAQFADDNMDNIRAAVDEPFGENNWWTKLDDPFQGLATCHEICQAIDSGDHESYMCSLPVHMDGSCNGLQHYAALGRDRGGGKAVNLCVADEPQDVYIGVMHEVVRRVAEDAKEMLSFDENKSDLTGAEKDQLKKVKSARLVDGLIDRGVVKRTVMTSVYGVTYIGAKNQISEKIEEKLEEKGHDIDEIEAEIHTACGYLASLTMEVMGQQFKGARETMNWLTKCARLIAAQGQPVSFISPIGVPVVQPYRQSRPFTVVTLLQNITLTNDSDVLPLHRQRQVSAFPPNYVHSLDSSHMLLTAIEMEKRRLHFSAVHDSYWTHPCDIEEMNVVLRESFVELYNRPLLEELKQTWEIRYPSIAFPDIPAQGDLDLNDVKAAPYFFQ